MLKCKNCKATEKSFVHDMRTDNWVCTLCGVVATHYWDPGIRNTNFVKQEEDIYDSSSDKKLRDGYYKLMMMAFPKEERDRKRKKIISDICFKIEAPNAIKHKALVLYENHKEELSKIKPTRRMLLACVVVASRASVGLFIPMSVIKNMFRDDASDINSYTKRVCDVIGMNQKTFSLAAIPYVTSHLRFHIKFEKVLLANYEKVGLIAPAMASETRLAVAACKMLKDDNREIDFDVVAYLTDTTVVAIKSFFEKNKKRRRDSAPVVSNKKSKK